MSSTGRVTSHRIRQIGTVYSDFDFHWISSNDLCRYAAAASLLRPVISSSARSQSSSS